MTDEQIKAMLALAPTEWLYQELLGRFDHVVFSAVKNHPTPDNPNQKITSWRLKGDYLTCQGLACGLISECQDNRNEDEQEIDTGDL